MRQAVATSPPGGRDRSGHAEQPLSRWSGSGVEGDLGDPEIAIRSGVLKREHVLDSRLREPPRTTNEIAPRPGDAEKPHRLTCSRLQPMNRAPPGTELHRSVVAVAETRQESNFQENSVITKTSRRRTE